MSEPAPNSSEIILYQTEDGRTRLQVRLKNETAWLSLNQLADLFQRDKSVISKHIKNVFEEGELQSDSLVANFATTAADGKTYQVDYYNLDVIIAVGYRVKSPRGTQFRVWATQRLREYIVKGFALDDERLQAAGGGDYFDELLQRIREIRISEQNFYRKICDIYQTSVDYDPRAEMTAKFFQAVQNKMHWAAHGHTAAEVIHQRADAAKPNAGLTSWHGAKPHKSDVIIAKNYLTEDELKRLGLIVSQYLDFAELQALDRKPMTMRDWIAKLDAFLMAGGQRILNHGGNVTAGEAKQKAEREFEQFEIKRRALEDAKAEAEFAQQVDVLAKQAKRLTPPKRKTRK
jgi:hypothetical protein